MKTRPAVLVFATMLAVPFAAHADWHGRGHSLRYDWHRHGAPVWPWVGGGPVVPPPVYYVPPPIYWAPAPVYAAPPGYNPSPPYPYAPGW